MDFEEIFKVPPRLTISAPGRVNLLGEHTDYNQGFVLPTPLLCETKVVAGKSLDSLEAYSENFKEKKILPLFSPSKEKGWFNYIVCCFEVLREKGFNIKGGQFYIESTVPLGSGLSSSASLEVAILRAFRAMYRFALNDLALAKLAQKAEQRVGVSCGIMDQMAISMGTYGNALFIDTMDLFHKSIPLSPEFQFVAIDSGIQRNLSESAYSKRQEECDDAAKKLGVPSLREVNPILEKSIKDLPAPLFQRARHVIGENNRVMKGMEALQKKDYIAFGKLMQASHASLRDDFSVSLPELDRLVEIAMKHGALGARLTGAGFGGSLVALVKKDLWKEWKEKVLQDYPKAKFAE